MCAQEVHTYARMKKISETMLLYNVYIAILTLTSEYRGTVTKFQAPFFSGMTDWWHRMPSSSKRLLKTPLHLYPSSEQHLTTHWGVGGIARVSLCRTQQV
jgi:hypothetical protein